jgi:MbtH protein
MNSSTGSGEEYAVLVNHELQYSIWPAARVIPSGWTTAGEVADRAECLRIVEKLWRDMRPLSVRAVVGEAYVRKAE